MNMQAKAYTQRKSRLLSFLQLPRKARRVLSIYAKDFAAEYRGGTFSYSVILEMADNMALAANQRFGIAPEIVRKEWLTELEFWYKAQDFSLPVDHRSNLPVHEKGEDGDDWDAFLFPR